MILLQIPSQLSLVLHQFNLISVQMALLTWHYTSYHKSEHLDIGKLDIHTIAKGDIVRQVIKYNSNNLCKVTDHQSFFFFHLPYTLFVYPSSLQSASYPRRVASSFPVSTWPLHSGAGACRGDLWTDSSAHSEPCQPGSHGRHQWHRWDCQPNILCCYENGPNQAATPL